MSNDENAWTRYHVLLAGLCAGFIILGGMIYAHSQLAYHIGMPFFVSEEIDKERDKREAWRQEVSDRLTRIETLLSSRSQLGRRNLGDMVASPLME